MALVIRHPLPTEDLSHFFDVKHSPLKWNCEQVYVAVDGERLVGIALVFDGGHDVVLVDYVRALAPWKGKKLWLRLLRRIETDMRQAGKVALLGYATGAQVLRMAEQGGAYVSPVPYQMLRKVL